MFRATANAKDAREQEQVECRRSTRVSHLTVYHENKDKVFTDPYFKCPQCYLKNYYPIEDRACNKLHSAECISDERY